MCQMLRQTQRSTQVLAVAASQVLAVTPLDMCCTFEGSTPFLLDNLHSAMQHLHRCRLPSHFWLSGRSHRRHRDMCCTSLGSMPFVLDNLHSTMQHLHKCRLPSRCWLSGRRRCPQDMCCTSSGSMPFLLDNLHRTMQHLHRCRLPSRCWLSGRCRRRHSLDNLQEQEQVLVSQPPNHPAIHCCRLE